MALFNKFFSRKNTSDQDNFSDKLFEFNKEQVRIVLFRECDFRGQKLLFDSTAIKKVQISSLFETSNRTASETFAEISDGFGYMFVKPPSDSNNLAEMIFGLVAMSYRGSYFKIHNLETPPRLMLTEVFPSPKHVHRKISSSSNCKTSSQSLEHSIRLDDSGTSINDHLSLSVHSTNSDTILVCRHSLPLNVPQKSAGSTSSLICDSGVYGRSSNSCEGNRQFNISYFDSYSAKGSTISFSNSTLYKKWLRSSSDHLTNSSYGSIEDTLNKPIQRSSKLGLALIIKLTPEQEESQIQFLMEHIAILESILWRVRRFSEMAYLRPNNFLSVLSRIVDFTSLWLTNLLSGPLLPLNLWTSLSSKISEANENFNSSNYFGCDNRDSINTSIHKDFLKSDSIKLTLSSNSLLNSNGSYYALQKDKTESTFSNLTKKLKNEWNSFNLKILGNNDKNSAEIFIKDFCELLENVDIKSTNFFISTLLTAVLTHHLGWVSTCLPPRNDEDQCEVDVNIPYNPLSGQLSDLYGAIGHPPKMAQTIVIGTKKKELISKIINFLTYFIRSCDLEKKNLVRSNVYDDDKTADYICFKNSCIPKENFKQYKDHLREVLNSDSIKKPKKFHMISENSTTTTKSESETIKKTFARSKKSMINLNELDETEEEHQESKKKGFLEEKVTFVLGDDEKLVHIKKTENNEKFTTPNFLDSIFKKYETFEEEFSKSNFKDDDFVKCENKSSIKPSTSWASLQQAEEDFAVEKSEENEIFCPNKPFVRSSSVPPKPKEKMTNEENKAKYRYSGIKFSLHQYPQVVTNYMRSKNLEMANLPFSEITKKFDQIYTETEEINLNFSQYDKMNSDEMEGLQTPSNASDLEYINDLSVDLSKVKESNTSSFICSTERKQIGKSGLNCLEEETEESDVKENVKMKIINFPLPKSEVGAMKSDPFPYSTTLLRGLNENYIPDLVLQGIATPKSEWESSLKNELALSSQHSFLNQYLEEAVAIIADTDKWEVQLVSSHTYVIDKALAGVRVGMSQLIASMLDSLLKMWKLQVPPELCLLHIEQRLQALCVRSRALAQLLLATEFCSMEFLTSTLHLEVNDVPLLLAVASTYSPEVTQKYGISFQ